MEFKDALIKLNIEDYHDKIFNSNSRGELVHIYDYVLIAESTNELEWFRDWFIKIVEFARKNWERPDSVYQHIGKILKGSIEEHFKSD